MSGNPEKDGDGVDNVDDNCPTADNPTQADGDTDGVPDQVGAGSTSISADHGRFTLAECASSQGAPGAAGSSR